MKLIHSFCPLPFRKVKVHSDGNVSMCCYQNYSALGSLFEKSFEEIWFGPLAREVREQTLMGDLHASCKGWGGCPFIVQPRTPQTHYAESDLPDQLEFDLPSTHCNIGGIAPKPHTACIMCPRSWEDFHPTADRTSELVEKIRVIVPYLRWLTVSGLAEPLWKGELFRILEMLKFETIKERCIVSFFSNASVLDAETRKKLIETCPTAHIVFSLDAATPETYKRVRRLTCFDRILRDFKDYMKEKPDSQWIQIANNINLVNIHEAVEMVDLARELGVGRVQFNPTHDGATGRTDLDAIRVSADNFHLFEEAERKILQRGKELGVEIIMTRPLALDYPERARAAARSSLLPHQSGISAS